MSLGATFVLEYPHKRNFTGSTCVKVHSIVMGGGCACADVIMSVAMIKSTASFVFIVFLLKTSRLI
jgi:hypothetical protein